MIGHYLLTLDVEQEERVLTTPFAGVDAPGTDESCLVTVAHKGMDYIKALGHMAWPSDASNADLSLPSPGIRYEDLCFRFGTERINTAIRNRILANQARRTLRNAPQLETA